MATKSNTGKIRIYDLAKSLITESLSEKEKKAEQSQKTKDILDACQALGLPNKSPSSSLDEEAKNKVLNKIGVEPSKTTQSNPPTKKSANASKPKTSNPKEEETSSKPEKKRVRILRRIVPEPELDEAIDEEAEEEIQDESLEEVDVIDHESLDPENEASEEDYDVKSESDNDENHEDTFTEEDEEQKIEETKEEEIEEVITAEQKIEKPKVEEKEFKEEPKVEIIDIEKTKEENIKNEDTKNKVNNKEKKTNTNPELDEIKKQEAKLSQDIQRFKQRLLQRQQNPSNNSPSTSGRTRNPQSHRGAVTSTAGTGTRPTTPGSAEANKGKSQPYRVARPVNNAFNPTRRKGPGKKGANKGNQQNKTNPQQSRKDALQVKPPEKLTINHPLTVKELSIETKVPETELIRRLFMKGVMKTVNQTVEVDLIIELCAEFECEVTYSAEGEEVSEGLASRLKELVDVHTADEGNKFLKKRPPVVTIMGHVDHGKTTLLDTIRNVKLQITDTESGGITQHIGAYQITVKDYDDKEREITFLDTPGHEAFTALRARGAQVTDIAILVVAADDGVMPQTIEAISHAKAAGVPIIVAVNKIDKPEAAPEKVLTQLIEHDLVVEDYGGSVVCSQISAKQKLNLDDLLSKITLVADTEIDDKLLADPTSLAVGAVVEATLSANKGPIATLLIQSGTLKKGDFISVGETHGRVRAIFSDIGNELEEAPPSTPVQILGLNAAPQAGDTFQVFSTYQQAKAKSAVEHEDSLHKKRSLRGLEAFSTQVREGTVKELPVIIKADVQGSAEAIASELNKLSNEHVVVRVVHCAAGSVTESDINLASATNAVIVNFNFSIDSSTLKIAEDNDVSIYTGTIIYEITEIITKAINGLLEPEKIETKVGEAEVRQLFTMSKNKIAGCYVTKGKMVRGGMAKIVRNGKDVAQIVLDSLKRFKDDVKEVQENFECGILFNNFNNIQEGDIIESWQVTYQERTI